MSSTDSDFDPNELEKKFTDLKYWFYVQVTIATLIWLFFLVIFIIGLASSNETQWGVGLGLLIFMSLLIAIWWRSEAQQIWYVIRRGRPTIL